MTALLARRADRVATLRRADPRSAAVIDLDFARNRYRVPKFRRNYVRSASLKGALTGNPGTYPPGIGLGFGPGIVGLQYECVSVTDLGDHCEVAIRWFGTNSSTGGGIVLDFETYTAVVGVSGQTWVTSVHAALAGPQLPAGGVVLTIYGRNTVGAAVESSGVDVKAAILGSTLKRVSHSYTLAGGATVANAHCSLRPFVTAGETVDFTIKFKIPQFERDALTDPIITNGAARTVIEGRRAGHHPLFKPQPGASYSGGGGYKLARSKTGVWSAVAVNELGETGSGFGVWEARTNSLPNPTALGAVVGTPGTLPTGWGVSYNPQGLSTAVIGRGDEDGLPFVDVRFFGAPAATWQFNFRPMPSNTATAAQGQTWAGRFYVRRVGGSNNNLTAVRPVINENTAAGVFIQATEHTDVMSGLGVARVQDNPASVPRTMVSASTGATDLTMVLRGNAGDVDITLRFAAPNLKLGVDINDPPILQTTNAAATRPADVMVLSEQAVPPTHSGVARFVWTSRDITGFPTAVQLDDGTNNNRVCIYRNNSSSTGTLLVAVAGATVAAISLGSLALDVEHTIAWRCKAGSYAVSVNGAAVATNTAATAVPVLSSWRAGQSAGNPTINTGNGTLGRCAIYFDDPTDAELRVRSAL